jgi:hypothetical protein
MSKVIHMAEIHRFSSRRQRLDRSFLANRLKGAQSYKRIAGYFRHVARVHVAAPFRAHSAPYPGIAGDMRVRISGGLS